MKKDVVPEDLLEAARTAWANAYVPYSKFRVGAALRSVSGAIFSGANVENNSYGLSRCAEQSAVQTMVSQGETEFVEILVYAEQEGSTSPCGACRQILHEFSPKARLYTVNHLGRTESCLVEDLLPGAFFHHPIG
ncbi:MAG: cytidine deaminase [Trueperaceae bacterium]|nr:MAG: cytidine deaminase [Trueperaceae bacterium]